MENEIEVVQTTTHVEVGLKDQLAVTLLSAVAGLVVSKLTERAYFNVKGRVQLARTKNN